MKIITTLTLFLISAVITSCGTTESTPTTSGSVLDVAKTLSAVSDKFVELAKASTLGTTPGEVLIQTTDWVKTQSDVEDAYWFDSTYIYIQLKSGLKAVFVIYRQGEDGLSTTRGGTPSSKPLSFNTTTSQNLISNKKILIFAPFVGTELGDLYKEFELTKLADFAKSTNKNVEVTVHDYDQCTLKDVESFGDYGLVIISTHGLPDAFFTGQIMLYSSDVDTTEALIKEQADFTLGPGGYEKVSAGDLLFANEMNISRIQNWADFVSGGRNKRYRIVLTAEYLDKLPSMPNTVILGNMCYSGWSSSGDFTIPRRGKVEVEYPIKDAFTNRDLISYYSYGYDDGTSEPVDNDFAKLMEDSLLRAFLVDNDSTGNAYLNASGNEFTAGQLRPNPESPKLPFKHWGKDDYSYDGCVSEFTDERDGQKYKAVCIGKQNWMAENLRYVTPLSMTYNDSAALASTYGRLYTWPDMMAGAASSDVNPSGVRGICPKGWHIPSVKEWETLFQTIGGVIPGGSKNAGDLKATTHWNPPNLGATDKYGFKGIGGGMYYPDSNICFSLNIVAHWWTSTISSSDSKSSRYATLSTFSPDIIIGEKTIDGTIGYKLSCRCVKD